MDFLGKKENGTLVHPPAIAEQKRRHWESIKEGAVVKSSISVSRASKSQSQLGAIWGLMLAEAVIQLDDLGYDTSFIYNLSKPTGIKIGKEDLCHFFYQACPIHNEEGQRITLSKSNTKEASKFLDDSRNYMSSQWGLIIENPNPGWKNEA